MKEYKLSELADIIGGGTPKTSRSDYWGGDIPWLSVVDFNNDFRHVFTTEKTITEAGLNNSSTRILYPGEIIISARGTVGALAQVAKEMAFNQSCYGLRAKPGITCNDYLFYLLRHSIETIKKNTHGSVFDTITRDTFESISVILPDLKTQQKVASILTAFDDKIELNAQINHNLEEQAKAIFKSWFVDFEPFQNGKFIDSELGQIPAGWQVADVYSIASVIYGAPFASKRFSSEKIGHPIVRIRDLATETPQVYTDEIHPKGYIIKPGDIVVGMDGEFRAYLWGGEEAWLNQRVCVFKPKDEFASAFVRLSIMPLLAAVEASEVATTVIHLGKNDIDKFKIILPDTMTLEKYNAVAIPIYEQIVSNKLEARRLVQLRDALLPKLMSGEIDVSEIEV